MVEEVARVSLIMATIGRSDEIERMICSLTAQSDHGFELIVVDQNCDDRILSYIEDGTVAGLNIQHVRLDQPSLSGARNLGVSMANYDIIAFPDDDCWYDYKVIETIRSVFCHNPDIDGVVAMWVEQFAGHIPTPYFLELSDWRRFRGGNASSISLFFRRELFHNLGGFDTRFGVGCWFGAGEETDLVLRALSKGSSLYFCPTAKVHHLFSRILHGNLRTMFKNTRSRSRATGAIYAKHRIDLKVILRGFFAPIINSLVKPTTMQTFLKGILMSLGRVEGYLRWRFFK